MNQNTQIFDLCEKANLIFREFEKNHLYPIFTSVTIEGGEDETKKKFCIRKISAVGWGLVVQVGAKEYKSISEVSIEVKSRCLEKFPELVQKNKEAHDAVIQRLKNGLSRYDPKCEVSNGNAKVEDAGR